MNNQGHSNSKLKYSSPVIEIDIIEMEAGIAATSSAKIQIGSEQNNFTPEVEDWQTSESQQQLFL